MTPAQAAHEWYRCLRERDADGMRALLDPGFTFRIAGSTPVSRPTRGVDEWIANVLTPIGTALAPVTFEPAFVVAEDDRAVGVARGTGFTTSGRPYASDYAHVMRVRDGVIVDMLVFLDTAQLQRAFDEAPR